MLVRQMKIVAAALSLVGCYQSDASLISDRQLAAPYASVTYRETGDSGPPKTLVRRGTTYTDDTDERVTVRLMPVDDGWYVVELGGSDNDEKQHYLYGYLNIDPNSGTAKLFASVSDDSQPIPAGMHACGDVVCIDSIDAYVSHAQRIVDAGTEPDTIYQFQFKE